MSLTFCSLGSGSKGNSYLLASEKTKLLVDAGLNAKNITCRLNEIGVDIKDITAILVTHEHSDHVSGINVLCKKYGIDVYANEKTMLKLVSKKVITENKNMRIFNVGESFYVGDIDVFPFKTPHDSACSCGFSLFCRGAKVTVATDIGHMTKTVLSACEYSDILVLEANHDVQMLIDGPYTQYLKNRVGGAYGHLSNELCGKTLAYLLDKGLKQVLLAHLSEENNTPELALATVKQFLEEKGAKVGKDVCVEVADQHLVSKCYLIE